MQQPNLQIREPLTTGAHPGWVGGGLPSGDEPSIGNFVVGTGGDPYDAAVVTTIKNKTTSIDNHMAVVENSLLDMGPDLAQLNEGVWLLASLALLACGWHIAGHWLPTRMGEWTNA